MIRKLSTADLLAKLSLSVLTIASYFLQMISGPFAEILVILAFLVLLLYLIKMVSRERN
jgi:hypothetical protein